MSPKTRPMDYQWYKGNSSLHGMQEVLSSLPPCQRSVWLLALTIALVGVCRQLTGITQAFINDETGSREAPYIPTRIPSVVICPTRIPLLDSVPSTDDWLGDDDKDYIKGFFVMTAKEVIYEEEGGYVLRENPKVEEILKRRYNGSVAALMASLVDVKKLGSYKIEVMPPIGSVNFTPFDTLYGPCFLAQCDVRVTEVLAEYAEYKMRLQPENRRRYGQAYKYRVFLGDADTVGIAPSARNEIQLHAGFDYRVSVRVQQRVRYRGRGGNRCVDRTQSDTQHCFVQQESLRCLASSENCVIYIPKSTTRQAVQIDSSNQTYCNGKRSGYLGCVMEGLLDEEYQREAQERCTLMCVQCAYDKTIQQTGGVDITIGLTINLDSLMFSKATTEYAIMTTEDYLAAVGGTVGLFFGASVLSCVQILVCTWGSLSGKLVRRSDPGGRMEVRKNVRQISLKARPTNLAH